MTKRKQHKPEFKARVADIHQNVDAFLFRQQRCQCTTHMHTGNQTADGVSEWYRGLLTGKTRLKKRDKGAAG